MKVAIILLTLIAATRSVPAGPYVVIAVYEPSPADKAKSDVEIPIADGMVLPDRAKGLQLSRVIIRFERSGLGAITTGTFRNFAVATTYQDDGKQRTDDLSVQASELSPSATKDLVVWTAVTDARRTSSFAVSIHGKFSPAFLCSQELILRHQFGKPRTGACPAKPAADAPKCAPASLYTKAELQPDRPLFAGGSEILFTFCRDGEDPVKWADVLKDGRFGKAEKESELQERHKASLHDLLVKKEILTKFVNQPSTVQSGADAPGRPLNLFVGEDLHFSVRRTGELFVVEEQDRTQNAPINEVVDQTSRLVIKAAGGGTGVCPSLASFEYQIAFKGEGDKPTTDVIPIGYQDGCQAPLDVELKQYLNKDVTLSIVQRLDTEHDLPIAQVRFKVASLGFQWTAPVLSEVWASLQAKSKADLTASSSIPIGIAIGQHGRERLALSFAFKASWNPRSAPELSRYFAIFGHLTVLADTSDGFSTELATGAGLSFAQFFHFGWAVGLNHTHYNYFLLSIDIKDISKYVLDERSD